MTDGTLKVANIADKQAQAAPTCRFKINCVVSGFPVELEGEGRAGDLKLIVDRLLSIGAEPPAARPEPTKTNGAPLCPAHNTPMSPSKHRAGTFYCKSSVGQAEDGRTLYCTKKA